MPKDKGKRFTQEEIAEIKAIEKALKAEAEKAGYTIMWTHYYRDDENSYIFQEGALQDCFIGYSRKYAATSCCLLIGDNCVSRGFAVCSYEDQPLKTKGRLDSLQRAFDAVNGKEDLTKMSRKGAMNIDSPVLKAEKTPHLTSLESARIAKIKPCEACRV